MRYVFDLERSGRGLRLNRFLHDLISSEKRKALLEDPEKAMQGLTDEEKDMVRRLDWKALQDYGASFFCLEKLARTKGVSNPEMVAHFRGETLDQFERGQHQADAPARSWLDALIDQALCIDFTQPLHSSAKAGRAQ